MFSSTFRQKWKKVLFFSWCSFKMREEREISFHVWTLVLNTIVRSGPDSAGQLLSLISNVCTICVLGSRKWKRGWEVQALLHHPWPSVSCGPHRCMKRRLCFYRRGAPCYSEDHPVNHIIKAEGKPDWAMRWEGHWEVSGSPCSSSRFP